MPGDIILLLKRAKNDNHMIYGSRDMKRTDIIFYHFGPFLPFYPTNGLKIKIRKKMKKSPGDLIILHKCTKNHDRVLHFSCDIVRDRCNCHFSFWAILCPLTPLTGQKIKILKNEKKAWRYHLFTHL